MNCMEYGHTNKDTVILLHGGGLSWWNYREIAEKLSSSYTSAPAAALPVYREPDPHFVCPKNGS